MLLRRALLVAVVLGLVSVGAGSPGLGATRSLTAYDLRLAGPAAATAGDTVRLTLRTARALRGEAAKLQRIRAGEWRTVDRDRVGRLGKARFAVTVTVAGSPRFRAVIRRESGRLLRSNRVGVVVQDPVEVVDITPPPSDDTTTPPVTTEPVTDPGQVDLPELPQLPPYPGTTTVSTAGWKAPSAMAISTLFCGSASAGTINQYGNGNGAEWELWIAGLWGFDWASYEWKLLAWSNWHYRDSSPHPLGGWRSWQVYPSGYANGMSTWSWNVTSGAWYAVQNWRYSGSAGYSSDWAHVYGDTTYPTSCQSL